jgi:hypothetical protein
MATEGSEMGLGLLRIHELEMSQAARYGGCSLSERIERRVAYGQQGNRTLCWLGGFLVRAGVRLQEYGRIPQPLPLGNSAVRR